MRFVSLFCGATFLLSACTMAPAPAPPPPPPAGGAATIAIVREFLAQEQSLASTLKADVPTAYLLISSDQKKSGERMCKAWMNLPTAKVAGELNPAALKAQTYWLLGQGSKSTDSCKNLVKRYDFAKADNFRSSYGLPLGSLLAVRFPDNRIFYADLTKASERQDRELLLSWYKVAATEESGMVVQSNSIAARMQRQLCSDNTGFVASLVTQGASMLGPFGFVVGVGKELLCEANVV